MCGVAGFFTGCEFAQTCALKNGGACRSLTTDAARSFRGWYDKASVRRSPRRELDPEDIALDLFPRHLVPHLAHPLIAQSHPERIQHLLTLTLYRFLTFTFNLEMQLVNDTTRKLIMHELPFSLDGAAILNAQKLICDEAYHALFCADLLDQAITLTEVAPTGTARPAFLSRLAEAQGASEDPGITQFLYTAVSEMLITATLYEARSAGEVPGAVSGVMLDHAADEARHHIFYRDLLGSYLTSLPKGDAQAAAAQIPEAIAAYMEPDLPGIRGDLLAVGFDRDDCEEILFDTYAATSHKDYVDMSAREIQRLLHELDLSPTAEVADAFAHLGERL